jgi:hypothetical protein
VQESSHGDCLLCSEWPQLNVEPGVDRRDRPHNLSLVLRAGLMHVVKFGFDFSGLVVRIE